MPAIGNIAINDGKATPVVHTFTPVNTVSGKAWLENRNTSLASGSETLTVETKRVPGDKTSDQVSLELTLPIVASVNGVDQVVRTQKAKLTFYESKQASVAEKKDLRVLMSNALLNASVADCVDNTTWLY